MRRWWNRYRRALPSRTRVIFVQVPGSVIVASGLRDLCYSTKLVVVPGELL